MRHPAAVPFSPYQRRLLFFLSVATFFEGYDVFAIAQILPSVRAEFGLTKADGGALLSVIGLGSILAYLLVRKADEWGRRRVLTVTIAGYTLCSLLTAASPNVFVFGALQLAARIFLTGEYAVAMVYAAEEYPAERRGLVIGVIQTFAVFGGIACAGLVPILLKTQLGWRAVFLVGGAPLVVVALARRSIRETERFTKSRAAASDLARSLLRIFRSPYRGRVLKLALLWCVTYVGTQNAIAFWKEFATSERGFTDAEVGKSLSVAAVVSLPLLFGVGKIIDRVGRRLGAVFLFSIASVGVFCSYTLTSRLGLTLALIAGIFGTNAVLPIMNAFTTELFPTHLRSDAFAWSNNLMGRAGFLASPLLIGYAAGHVGWGKAVAATSIFPIVALALIWLILPETRGKELEETSRVE